MKIKIIENYNTSFELEPNTKATLFDLLTDESFLEQVRQQVQGTKIEFTELLFQPVPYSLKTPKGMPSELEKYHNSEDYIIINVPPHFMFKAKVFQPSRLCAIYRKVI